MVDPVSIFGVPPLVVAYVMAKCAYEVEQPSDLSEEERNALYLKCILDNLVPTGLPDPDKYDDDP
ncbi:hypothetical protein [Halorubrum sp. N11]|uniref:hypothetical protein n=1 Tax=Halorubrum sp. N11 TaxID=3402276 RepID=UPI003EC0EFBD